MAQGPTHKRVQDAIAASDAKARDYVAKRKLTGDAAQLATLRIKCGTIESVALLLAREVERLRKQLDSD